MGRPKSSCFSCNGAGPVEDDDPTQEEETKASSDKRRWSFRKRSGSHRVLGNSVSMTSESVLAGGSTENLEVATNNFQSEKYSSVAEKDPNQHRLNVTFSLPSATVITEEAYAAVAVESTPSLQESDAIIIQSFIRGYLARKELKKLRSVVKLQAAARGHLVRRQAVGTLRCVQAIIKMQVLVRTHHARHLVEKLSASENKEQMDHERSIQQEKENSYKQPQRTFSSTEKLLSNNFARQLLESTSKTKPINIKCDPSKSDSAWRWLERWMVVTSPRIGQQQELDQENQETKECTEVVQNEEANEVPYEATSALNDPVLAPSELVVQDANRNFTVEDAGDFEFKAPTNQEDDLSSLVKDDVHDSQLHNEILDVTHDKSTKPERTDENVVDSLSDHSQFESDPSSEQVEHGESNDLKQNTKSEPSDMLETEGKKYLQGSRRPCNPAFAAVQSKFEELSSSSFVGRSISPVHQDASAKSKQNSDNFQFNSLTKSKENDSTENSVVDDPKAQVAASECGTEISISSTLDSPDRSETEGGEIVLEIGALETENYAINADGDGTLDFGNLESEKKIHEFKSDATGPQVDENGGKNLVNSFAVIDSPEADFLPAEPNISDMQNHLETMIDEKVKSSPEGTPRSHVTAPNSHGVPSGQISVNAKKSKKDANVGTQKQKSILTGKRLPSNSGNDSGGKSSMESISKDKIGKRRNSFGMPKPENVDQEPRISSSSSLPSYMQATVSARAKIHGNVSPKSSPDGNDTHNRKRHSLPIENEKQGSSPRMQRSTSQAQQNSKANGTHSPHNAAERWQR